MSPRFFVVHSLRPGLAEVQQYILLKTMKIKKIIPVIGAMSLILGLGSCNGVKNLVIPHAVSTATSISMGELNLKKGDYDILNTVTETASVSAKYSGSSLTIKSLDGDFAYWFIFKPKTGWYLNKFSGTASFGYLMNDPATKENLPDAEEFARRVAIAKLIDVIKDYNADGALDPIVTTRVTNSDQNTVEYHATASAKIIKIHSTN